MPTLTAYERGFRDGFHGREPREASEAYLEGYQVGARDGDRTRKRDGDRTRRRRVSRG